jgi:hypothetical protein
MNRQKLGNPLFIMAVVLLVLNDWYLKQTFHNGLTGKLSDLAGLFAFPFLLSVLWPRKSTAIYVFTFLFFVIWKSPVVQPLIDGLNSWQIPIQRVMDYTDYTALIVLPFSLYIFHKSWVYSLKPAFTNLIIGISLLSFIATSMPPGAYTRFNDINKTYTFDLSKRELVARLNALQLEYVQNFNKYLKDSNKLRNNTPNRDTTSVDFDSKNNVFYYNSPFTGKKDTLAMLIDYERVKDADVIKLKTMYASLSISGNNTTSQLKLLSLTNYVRKVEKGDHKQFAIEVFEKYTVKKINPEWR